MDYYRPPSTQLLEADDPEALATRMRNARAESWARGLGVYNYLVGLLWISFSVYYGWIVVGVARGTLLSPWASDYFFAFFTATPPILAIMAFVSGYGLYHLKRWASAAEATYALAMFAFFGLSAAHDFAGGMPRSGMSTIAFAILVSVPLSVLFMRGIDEVLAPDYHLNLAAAPSVRPKTRLPLVTVIAMVVLAGAYVFFEFINR